MTTLDVRIKAGAIAVALAMLAAGAALAQAPQTPPPSSSPPPEQTPPPAEQGAPPPTPVEQESLNTLDLFSTGRDTGLGNDVWKGSSADLARAIIPTFKDHPLSPAGASLARRLLATASIAPDGAGQDADLAAARAEALLALGDAEGAGLILDHTTGVPQSPALSQAAAEVALILGQDDKACAIGDALATGRDALYWLKLRAFCQAKAGKPAAQLTLTLVNQQTKDATFDRMINVIIAGSGDPGPASLRDGLDYAMSRKLGLDLSTAAADAPPAIAERLAVSNAGLGPPQTPPTEADVLAALRKAKTTAGYVTAAKLQRPAIDALVAAKVPLQSPVQIGAAAIAAGDLDAAQAIAGALSSQDATTAGAGRADIALFYAALAAAGGKVDGPSLDRLVERGAKDDPKTAARAQAAAALLLALGWPMSGEARGEFASFDLGKSAALPARTLLRDAAAAAGVKGDTILLCLELAETGGADGPAPADRALIIGALAKAGLPDHAASFAVEGLIGLESR